MTNKQQEFPAHEMLNAALRDACSMTLGELVLMKEALDEEFSIVQSQLAASRAVGEKMAAALRRIKAHPARISIGGRKKYGLEPIPPCQDIAEQALTAYERTMAECPKAMWGKKGENGIWGGKHTMDSTGTCITCGKTNNANRSE